MSLEYAPAKLQRTVLLSGMQDIESFLEANSTYEELLEFIQEEVCTLLPEGDQQKVR